MTPAAERFWEKVDKDGPTMPGMETQCWVWTASKRCGYGRLGKAAGGMVSAHRFSYEVIVILEDLKSGRSKATIARDFGVSRSAIRLIAQAKTWKHLSRGAIP